MGREYSKVDGLRRHARNAVIEMHRQVGGVPVTGDDGLIKRGLIIRHLVLRTTLPQAGDAHMDTRYAGAGDDAERHVAVLPTHRALTMPLLDRKLRESEYMKVIPSLKNWGWRTDGRRNSKRRTTTGRNSKTGTALQGRGDNETSDVEHTGRDGA